MTPVPDTETLIRLFSYDQESGKLFFNNRTPDMFSAFPGKSLKDICDDHGLNVHTVASRIRKQGMTIEQALSAPLKRRVS